MIIATLTDDSQKLSQSQMTQHSRGKVSGDYLGNISFIHCIADVQDIAQPIPVGCLAHPEGNLYPNRIF